MWLGVAVIKITKFRLGFGIPPKPFLLSFTKEIFGYTIGNGLRLGIEIRDAKNLTSFYLEI